MTGSRKKLLFISGSLIALVSLSVAAVVFFVDINSYKPGIERSISGLLGMDFKINGRIGVRLFPVFGFYLEKVTLRNKGTDLVLVKEVKVGLKLIPLIRHEMLISECDLVNPVFSVERGENGVFNYESPERKSAGKKSIPLPLLTVGKFNIWGGSIVYEDKKTGAVTALEDFNLAIRNLSLPGKTEDLLRNASFSGGLTCRAIRMRNFTATNLRCSLKGGRGAFNFSSIVMDAFGGTGKGDVEVDFRGTAPRLRIHFKSPVFSVPESDVGFQQEKGPGAGKDTSRAKTVDMLNLTDVELDIAYLSFSAWDNHDLLRTVSLSGDLRCGHAKVRDMEASNLTLVIKGAKGLFEIDPVRMNFFGGSGEGSIKADLGAEVPTIKIRFAASKFHSEKFMEKFSRKKIVKGEMDLFTDLETEGKTWAEMRKRIAGTVLLKGDNLLPYNLDLDRVLSKIRESQNVSLVDVGAYFFVGPFGPLLTKGYDFADIAAGEKGGQSLVQSLISKWRVKNSIAGAEDVALATKQDRLALKGNLDFVRNRFDDVTVAVLDKKGCATLTQKIYGPFSKPLLEKPNVPKSAIAPVTNIFEEVKKLFAGGKCKVFYEVSVKHPVN